MSKVVIKPIEALSKPNSAQLVKPYESKQKRSNIMVPLIYHEGDFTYILNKSGILKKIKTDEYLQSLSPRDGKSPVYANPHDPMTIQFKKGADELTLDENDPKAKFFKECPFVIVNGKRIDSTFNYSVQLEYVSLEQQKEKEYLSYETELDIRNYISDCTDEVLKEICYHFSYMPSTDRKGLLLQISGVKGFIWQNNSQGFPNIEELRKYFIEGNNELRELKTTINKAIILRIIPKVSGVGSNAPYFEYHSQFCGTTDIDVMDYFQKNERMFLSLKGELSRLDTTVKKDDLPQKLKGKSERFDLMKQLSILVKEEKASWKEGVSPMAHTLEDIKEQLDKVAK
jgi:hypothetical protein